MKENYKQDSHPHETKREINKPQFLSISSTDSATLVNENKKHKIAPPKKGVYCIHSTPLQNQNTHTDYAPPNSFSRDTSLSRFF